MKFLFCNIGWMEHYNGLNKNDSIQGGGAFVAEEGRGHEVCNFSEDKGFVYGYVEPTGKPNQKQINIERLGADKTDEYINGITVIWTANHPDGGTVITGWYKNATVYKDYKKLKKIPLLYKKNYINGFRIKADSKDVKLLPIDERTFEIPRRVKGGMGQSNVWFADTTESTSLLKEISKLLKGKMGRKKSRSKKTDPERNAKVEKSAINLTTKYFEDIGYIVDSVEKDNVGWDLEANRKKNLLKIEVKGLSGDIVNIELTSNEYKAFSKKKEIIGFVLFT